MIIIKWICTKWIWQYYLIYVIYVDFIIILIVLFTHFIFTIVYGGEIGHKATNSNIYHTMAIFYVYQMEFDDHKM